MWPIFKISITRLQYTHTYLYKLWKDTEENKSFICFGFGETGEVAIKNSSSDWHKIMILSKELETTL